MRNFVPEAAAESGAETAALERMQDAGGRPELPDDSGDKRYALDLPDDSGEKLPEKVLTPEEISQKQDEILQSVESGETPLKTDQEKGNYGEMKVDQDLREKGYQRISLDAVTALDAPTHSGIDGVYYNPDGKPPFIIVDAKYNTARPSKRPEDGPQMSGNWIDKRLDAAVGKEKADEIRMAQLNGDVGCYIGKVAPNNDLRVPVSYNRVDEAGKETEKGVKINAA